jgi:hypothetical protein
LWENPFVSPLPHLVVGEGRERVLLHFKHDCVGS